mgnify:CR=1 FL=1
MGGKEKRNFMLGSLILVLVISIGYFGISSASNTYAVDSGTSDTDAIGGKCYDTVTACEKANPGYKCRSTDGTCWTKGDPISYTISYNANGGSEAPGSQTKTHGTDLKLSSTKPTRKGYNFSKWTTGKDGSGTSYAPGAIYNANASITLYAQWISACRWATADACQKANPGYMCKSTGTDGACWDVDKPSTYTISYNANGGSGAPGSQTKTHGTDLKLSNTKPTRSGYTFVNWNTKSDGSGTNYASGATYNTNANITLYAIWKTNSSGGDTTTKYTVSYNANGGTGGPTFQKKTKGKDISLSNEEPQRNGYKFLGYNINSDNINDINNKELNAKWSILTYNINYNLNGGYLNNKRDTALEKWSKSE